MYKYIVYVEIFVTVNFGTGRDNGRHSKPQNILDDEKLNLKSVRKDQLTFLIELKIKLWKNGGY